MTPRPAAIYLLVSALCLVAHNLVINVMYGLGFHLISAVIVSFVVVVPIGYLFHCRLTFREQLYWFRFQKYAGAMAGNIPLSYINIWFLHEVAGLKIVWSSLSASIIMVAVNYLLSRWAIVISRALEE